MTGSRLSSVRPEKKEQLIAASPGVSSGSEHRKQRETTPLVTVLSQKRVVLGTNQRQRAERS